MRPGSIGAALRQRMHDWRETRQPRTDRLALTQRNLYILPTASGWLFALLLLALLLASINYQLNLGHLLTFSLASAGLVALHATHAALRGLELTLASAEPVFAGERLELQIRLDDRHPARRPWRFGRHGIVLRWREPNDTPPGAGGGLAPRGTSVPEGGSVTVRLERSTSRRGAQALPPLEIECRFPLGLFRAWAVWRIAREPLVWPAPEPDAPPLPEPLDPDDPGLRRQARSGAQDGESGMRAWRRGDRPSQVLWKPSARSLASGGTLLVRDPPRPPEPGQELRLDACAAPLASLDAEARLRRLCAWVLEAERRQRRWTLVLGSLHIGPGGGTVQRRAALDALALWSGTLQ
ncbi:MAG: hypothetical protein RL654_950 [Pseudomonadota bacterium]|jgi:uncharacterized protein (DUF58 family)